MGREGGERGLGEGVIGKREKGFRDVVIGKRRKRRKIGKGLGLGLGKIDRRESGRRYDCILKEDEMVMVVVQQW